MEAIAGGVAEMWGMGADMAAVHSQERGRWRLFYGLDYANRAARVSRLPAALRQPDCFNGCLQVRQVFTRTGAWAYCYHAQIVHVAVAHIEFAAMPISVTFQQVATIRAFNVFEGGQQASIHIRRGPDFLMPLGIDDRIGVQRYQFSAVFAEAHAHSVRQRTILSGNSNVDNRFMAGVNPYAAQINDRLCLCWATLLFNTDIHKLHRPYRRFTF